MWVNPNHPNPPRPSAAPQETGEILAIFPRGRSEELRVALAEFEGSPYVSLRVWAAGSDGQLWPVKGKGVSIRLREVADLAAALTEIADRLGDDDGAVPGRSLAAERRRNEQGPRATSMPYRTSGDGSPRRPTGSTPVAVFDEFEDSRN